MEKALLEATLGLVRTVTVQRWRGTAEVTRDEFVNEWAEQVEELVSLAHDMDTLARVRDIQASVKELAGEEFDRLWNDERANEREIEFMVPALTPPAHWADAE